MATTVHHRCLLMGIQSSCNHPLELNNSGSITITYKPQSYSQNFMVSSVRHYQGLQMSFTYWSQFDLFTTKLGVCWQFGVMGHFFHTAFKLFSQAYVLMALFSSLASTRLNVESLCIHHLQRDFSSLPFHIVSKSSFALPFQNKGMWILLCITGGIFFWEPSVALQGDISCLRTLLWENYYQFWAQGK